MGPITGRSAGQRTFLLLTLIVGVLFGVRFESDCNGFKNLPASVGSRSVESIFLLSDCTTRHLGVVMYICGPIGLQ